MPYDINIEGMHELIFKLQNLCHASKSFCIKYQIHKYNDEETDDYDWAYYFGRLKNLVCDYLIQCSIKLRILLDILRNDDHNKNINFVSMNEKSLNNIDIGKYLEGNGNITVREICNKIIHATDTQFDWQEIEKDSIEFWSGIIFLYGKKNTKVWALELNVEAFCTAFLRFIDLLEDEVDWSHLYKYDQ